MSKNIQQIKYEGDVGFLYLVASGDALKGVFWKKQNIPMTTFSEARGAEARTFKRAITQIEEYLHGQRKHFDLLLEPEGTDFQKRVWQKLSEIPYGVTRAYKDIAIELGDPNASRAVGTANGKNPLSIIVPCHRVISSDGSLGGYAGGLATKTKLLSIERKFSRSKRGDN